MGALTGSADAKDYWYRVKKRESEHGIELSTICRQLKLLSSDGKKYATDCANTEGAFRLVQSIPSKNAEPFKLWLAKTGYERVQEIENPQLAQERMKKLYEQKGYSKQWIELRLRDIAIRQNLTDEWTERGVNSKEDFAILTAEISKASFGMTPAEYKKYKGLKKENLRDHMDNLELVFNMLGEASTAELERVKDPKTLDEHKEASKEGGSVAKGARLDLEKKTGKKVISNVNYIDEPEKVKRLI